ncbi:MAG: GNAT family N-acetyltransferase [Akkermansia sp.]|nr:GNAT family N-acetyltransferase [Akkermansia sp.]
MWRFVRVTEVETESELWSLYENTFPRCERRSFGQHVRAMLEQPSFVCVKICVAERVAGLVFFWEMKHCLFLEHLAIAPECRRQGVGRMALKWLQGKGLPIVLEIEPPVDTPTCGRLKFYESCGFLLLPYPHKQAAFHADTHSVPLGLLSWPHVMSPSEVEAFERILSELVMTYTDA